MVTANLPAEIERVTKRYVHIFHKCNNVVGYIAHLEW